MPERTLFCQLPAESAALVTRVEGLGGIPIIDLTSTATTAVPDGAWVRVRSRRGVPGSGPVLLVGTHTKPVPDRETWLELTEPGELPEGFAGVVLRGSEAGGSCGTQPLLQMLASLPGTIPVLVDGVVASSGVVQEAPPVPGRLGGTTRHERAGTRLGPFKQTHSCAVQVIP